MALAKMREIGAAIRSRWPAVTRIALVHRIGRLEIGESSVMIAVSSPHRARGLRGVPLRDRHAQGDGADLEEGALRGRRGLGGIAVAVLTTATSLVVRVQDTIRRHGMLRGGETVLVAVSGGADSVALLDVLSALREPLGLTLAVVHVHHGLRPEADAEADGVRRLCERLGVACHVERVTVRRAPPWDGLEAESRRARHAALERVGARGRGRAHRHRPHRGRSGRDRADAPAPGRGPARAGRHRAGARAPDPPADRDAAGRDRGVPARARARLGGGPEQPRLRFLRNRIRHDLLPFMAELTGASVVEALGRSAAAAARRWWPIWKSGPARISRAWPPATGRG